MVEGQKGLSGLTFVRCTIALASQHLRGQPYTTAQSNAPLRPPSLYAHTQLAAVGVMCALALLFGQWPAASLSPSSSSSQPWGKVTSGTSFAAKAATSTSAGVDGSSPKPARASSGSTGAAAAAAAAGGGVPADAVAISPEEAVSLVDGI